jgi:hypothetical protein|mmetsp:Transcript_30169/g.51008  ORF Transcript_30169/g.51008 Transcript_30169/m.51008 type:complete len:131 (-) Transcript_30169:172-564(-)
MAKECTLNALYHPLDDWSRLFALQCSGGLVEVKRVVPVVHSFKVQPYSAVHQTVAAVDCCIVQLCVVFILQCAVAHWGTAQWYAAALLEAYTRMVEVDGILQLDATVCVTDTDMSSRLEAPFLHTMSNII